MVTSDCGGFCDCCKRHHSSRRQSSSRLGEQTTGRRDDQSFLPFLSAAASSVWPFVCANKAFSVLRRLLSSCHQSAESYADDVYTSNKQQMYTKVCNCNTAARLQNDGGCIRLLTVYAISILSYNAAQKSPQRPLTFPALSSFERLQVVEARVE